MSSTTTHLKLFEETKVSKLYIDHRPSIPTKLVEMAIEYTREKIDRPLKQMVEVGCGSGQATKSFSKHFEKVLATDISRSQINQLQQALSDSSFDNIAYRYTFFKFKQINTKRFFFLISLIKGVLGSKSYFLYY